MSIKLGPMLKDFNPCPAIGHWWKVGNWRWSTKVLPHGPPKSLAKSLKVMFLTHNSSESGPNVSDHLDSSDDEYQLINSVVWCTPHFIIVTMTTGYIIARIQSHSQTLPVFAHVYIVHAKSKCWQCIRVSRVLNACEHGKGLHGTEDTYSTSESCLHSYSCNPYIPSKF